MSSLPPKKLTSSWLLLIAVTLMSFSNAEFLPWREVAIFAVMAIAAAKAVVILRGFMDLATAPDGVRVYLMFWTFGCAVGVTALWLAAR